MVTFQKFAILHKIKVKGTLSDTQGCRLGTEATSTASRKDGALKVGKTAQKYFSWSLELSRNKKLKRKVCSLPVKLKDLSS